MDSQGSTMTPDGALPPTRQILVVDDDTSLREHVAKYLSEHGYQVHAAVSYTHLTLPTKRIV